MGNVQAAAAKQEIKPGARAPGPEVSGGTVGGIGGHPAGGSVLAAKAGLVGGTGTGNTSPLSKITRGKVEAPGRYVFQGTPGVGKTTLASRFPSPIYMDLEDGSAQLDVVRLPRPMTWQEALGQVRALATEAHDFRTLTVDTIDALESLAIRDVCERGKKATLADFAWGAGTTALVDSWRVLLGALEALRAKGIAVVLLCHVHTKTFNDPQVGPYDRIIPKLSERVWSLTSEWADMVAFCQFEMAVYEKDGQRARGIVTGNRIMRTVSGSGFTAKNRWSLPAVLPLDFGALTDAIARHGVAPEVELRAKLTTMLLELDDEEASAKSASYLRINGESAQTFSECINAVQFRLNEKLEKSK